MRLSVRVQPKSSQEKIVPFDGGSKIYVHESATDGKANEAVIRLLAKEYNVPKSSIEIVKGHTARNKIIEINK